MTHTHHAIDYVELTVGDVDRAKQFYAAAFGWSFNDYGPEYAGIRGPDGDDEVGGLNAVGGLTVDGRGAGGPLVLLYSADLDATVSGVEAAGGRVTTAPYEFPGGRRFHFADPDGNELGVWATA
jgi:predicted enzyme related to lactoylglutathione lyase